MQHSERRVAGVAAVLVGAGLLGAAVDAQARQPEPDAPAASRVIRDDVFRLGRRIRRAPRRACRRRRGRDRGTDHDRGAGERRRRGDRRAACPAGHCPRRCRGDWRPVAAGPAGGGAGRCRRHRRRASPCPGRRSARERLAHRRRRDGAQRDARVASGHLAVSVDAVPHGPHLGMSWGRSFGSSCWRCLHRSRSSRRAARRNGWRSAPWRNRSRRASSDFWPNCCSSRWCSSRPSCWQSPSSGFRCSCSCRLRLWRRSALRLSASPGVVTGVGHRVRSRMGALGPATYVSVWAGIALLLVPAILGETLEVAGGLFRAFGLLFVLTGFLIEYAAWTTGLGALILNNIPTPRPAAPQTAQPSAPEAPPAPAPDVPPPPGAALHVAGGRHSLRRADWGGCRRWRTGSLRGRSRRLADGIAPAGGRSYSSRIDSSRALKRSSQVRTVCSGPVSLKKYGPAGVSTTAAFSR